MSRVTGVPERGTGRRAAHARTAAGEIADGDLGVDLDRLRADVLRSLREQGFEVGNDGTARL